MCPCPNKVCCWVLWGWLEQGAERMSSSRAEHSSLSRVFSCKHLLKPEGVFSCQNQALQQTWGPCLRPAHTLIEIWSVQSPDGVSSAQPSMGWMKPQGKDKVIAQSCRNTQVREANLQGKTLPDSVWPVFPVDLGMAFVNSPANLTAMGQHMTSEVLLYFF